METRNNKKKVKVLNIEEYEVMLEYNDADWKRFLEYAQQGKFDLIPPKVLIIYYTNIREIHNDYLKKHLIEFNSLNR